jgi:uncharacterized FlgJ-related protein
MENNTKTKYDNIPLIVVDTRQEQRTYHRPERGLKVVESKEQEAIPELRVLLKHLILSLQKPFVALKYKLFKLLDKLFEDVEVPWLKLIALCLIAFMAFKRDMALNLSYNVPEGSIDQYENVNAVARNTTFSTGGNPYAPVSAHSLADKKALIFINQYESVAKAEMKKFGIPASIKMAQALIESRAGSSRLAEGNNNHFGIKCFSRNCKKGHCTNATDDHHKDFFRKFGSVWESWRAHSNLLMGKRYKSLQAHGKDYKAWATGLKKAGYATDKRYDKKLINTIEKFKLYLLDQ